MTTRAGLINLETYKKVTNVSMSFVNLFIVLPKLLHKDAGEGQTVAFQIHKRIDYPGTILEASLLTIDLAWKNSFLASLTADS